MSIGKLSGIAAGVQQKCANAIGDINKSKISKAINEIDDKAVKNAITKADASAITKTMSPSEALRAQVLADYQYPAGSDLLGCASDDWMIQSEIQYLDLPSVRAKIKAGTLAKSEILAERRLAKLCDEFGSDKVLAEVNARMEGFPGSLGYGYYRPSAAAESARAIIKAHGWD